MWTRIKHLFRRKKTPAEMALDNPDLLPSDPAVQSAMASIVLSDLIKERRRDRQWVHLKRLGFAAFFVIGTLFYVKLQADVVGWRLTPRTPLVGVVRIDGDIMSTSLASAEKVVPALEKAFESKNVEAVVLAIDSPGGAPLEAERINYVLDKLRAKHPKPVYAVIQNVGASAAYMIAVHTDKVYAGRYSIVGSVGAVMSSWNVHGALEKLNVEQKVFASGKLKAMLNPFMPSTPEAEAKAQSLVNSAGQRFVQEVKDRRGDKLDASTVYDTGEIWDGATALKMGLIDEIGTIESVAAQYENAKVHEFGPSRPSRGIFSSSVGTWLSESIRDGVRAAVTGATQGALQ